MSKGEVLTGKVKFFNTGKGFGFIEPDKGGENIFFHISGTLSKDIRDNDAVSYQDSMGKRGPVAVEVTVL